MANGADGPACVPLSFELFPPRSAAGEKTLRETIRVLAATRPDFISVTYGAGGSSRQQSLDVLRYIRSSTSVTPLAHLTCVGSSTSETSALIRDFLDTGITSFLALRGDLPANAAEGEFPGEIRTSAELVQLIHRVRAERAQYETLPSRTGQQAGRLPTRRDKVRVAVATFPHGHSRDTRRDQDIDALIAKQTAGATMAITQLFFEADDYLDFIVRAHDRGVTIPILPGVMPAVSPVRLRRVVELTGAPLPVDLAASLDAADDENSQFAVGVEHAIALSRRLLDGGAPGLHLYTFNQHRPVIAVLRGAALLPTEFPDEAGYQDSPVTVISRPSTTQKETA